MVACKDTVVQKLVTSDAKLSKLCRSAGGKTHYHPSGKRKAVHDRPAPAGIHRTATAGTDMTDFNHADPLIVQGGSHCFRWKWAAHDASRDWNTASFREAVLFQKFLI